MQQRHRPPTSSSLLERVDNHGSTIKSSEIDERVFQNHQVKRRNRLSFLVCKALLNDDRPGCELTAFSIRMIVINTSKILNPTTWPTNHLFEWIVF